MASAAQTIIEHANLLYTKGLCDQAIALLSEALEKEASQDDLVFKIAELLIDSAQHRLALKFLEELNIPKTESVPLILRGFCDEAIGEFAVAEQDRRPSDWVQSPAGKRTRHKG